MKIGESPKSASSARLDRKRGVGGAAPAAANSSAEPAGQVTLAGIAEADLTPRVREALTSLMQEVQSLRDQLSWSQERITELERLADSDPMLDTFNRRAFVRELDRTLGLIDRYGMKASLIFVDLNDLKKINDAKGHGAGDAALGHVATVLSANVRQSDAVGRLGGDEFGVILTQADQQLAEMKAQQLQHAVASTLVPWKDGDFAADISCGVVEIAKGLSADEAMARADSAMYAQKSLKENR